MNVGLSDLRRFYDGYVDGYRLPSGALPELMQLKLEHTQRVVENARLIADAEGFAADEREAALAAALLHDTGRYEQLKRYNTFKDSDSIDHAVFSHDIVVRQGWLGARPDREAILAAVLHHNRRDLPTGLDRVTTCAAQTVRDADKLDIFRVLEERTRNPNWRQDTRAFWNLQIVADPSPEVVSCIERRQPVDYQAIKSLADFVLIQIGWMISGLYYATSRRLCTERGHLEFRRRFLHELTSVTAVDRLCDLARDGQHQS